MGSNCSACNCNFTEDNSELKELISSVKKGKRDQAININQSKNSLNPAFLIHIDYIVRIQKNIRKYLKRLKQKRGHKPRVSSIKFRMNEPKKENTESFDQNNKYGLKDEDKVFVTNYLIDKSSYTGEMVKGFRHGKGIQLWEDGAKYDGEWRYDKANGHGTFYHIDGDIYQDDRANGEGTYINADGSTYQGQWVDDVQEGHGVENWNDGSSYRGNYHQGKKHGYGVYNWVNGDRYEGHWAENMLNGKGTFYYSDGRKYEGDYLENFMHGFGHYVWGDGREYIGEYKYDKKHGFGKYLWKDGRKYIGYWNNGKQEGYGKYILKDGSVFYGVWTKGKRSQNWFVDEQIELMKKDETFKRILNEN